MTNNATKWATKIAADGAVQTKASVHLQCFGKDKAWFDSAVLGKRFGWDPSDPDSADAENIVHNVLAALADRRGDGRFPPLLPGVEATRLQGAATAFDTWLQANRPS